MGIVYKSGFLNHSGFVSEYINKYVTTQTWLTCIPFKNQKSICFNMSLLHQNSNTHMLHF